MPIDPNKAQGFMQGFKGQQGLGGFKNLLAKNDSDPTSDALKKRQDKLNQMKMDYDNGPVSK